MVLSLFPGIGLLDRAFEEEGFCVVRGPDVLWGGDVRRFHPPAGRFDGVIGGPPCQSFSSLVHLVRANGNEPRFGNLIPDFARCVAEACPAWFLMENVPAAPRPEVPGYQVASFILEHDALDAGDGFGYEQMRTRRFSFGIFGRSTPDLRQWIRLAVLRLPLGSRTQAVTTGRAAVEVAIGGSGKRKPGARLPAVLGHGGTHPEQRLGHTRKPAVVGGSSGITAESEHLRAQRIRKNAVCGGSGKSLDAKPGSGGGFKRYSYEEACRLQGLPEDFLADAPFLKGAKRDVVAAGVPLPMGRAIARAVKAALAKSEATA